MSPDYCIPTAISISAAAALSGLSRETFYNRCITTGLVAVDADRRVLVWSLAAYLGRPLEIDDLLSADAQLVPSRTKARNAQRQRRAHA